ncbi:MAG: electron transfer flavoprotein subunit alpha/FixB family protein, partial [Acidobacteriota bacterium]
MSNNYLVVVEHEEGRIRRGSYESLALARRLAADGGRPVAAVLGADRSGLADEIAKHGAD